MYVYLKLSKASFQNCFLLFCWSLAVSLFTDANWGLKEISLAQKALIWHNMVEFPIPRSKNLYLNPFASPGYEAGVVYIYIWSKIFGSPTGKKVKSNVTVMTSVFSPCAGLYVTRKYERPCRETDVTSGSIGRHVWLHSVTRRSHSRYIQSSLGRV